MKGIFILIHIINVPLKKIISCINDNNYFNLNNVNYTYSNLRTKTTNV